LKYALGDVTHLRVIYEKLSAKIGQAKTRPMDQGRTQKVIDKENFISPRRSVGSAIKVPTHKPRTLGILREIAAWREQTAQSADVAARNVF